MFPCSYDDEADKVNQYQRLNLDGLEKIEIGKTLESTRAEVRISALAESPDTSQKCARQLLCNRLAVSPPKNDSRAADAAENGRHKLCFLRQAQNRLFLGSPSSAACACITRTKRRVDTFTLCERPRGIRRTTEKVGILAAAGQARSVSSHVFVWTYSVMLCRRHVTVHS